MFNGFLDVVDANEDLVAEHGVGDGPAVVSIAGGLVGLVALGFSGSAIRVEIRSHAVAGWDST